MSPPEIAGSSWRPSEADRISSTWQDLMRHLDERLQYLRVQLENPAHEDRVSNVLRGEIKEVKRLLALNKDLPKIDPPAKGTFGTD